MYFTPYEIYKELTVKDSIPAPHIKKLSRVLEHITLDNDYYNRACVSQPPRTAKSSLITLSYPFWLIINNPNFNIVIVNNTKSLAENFGIRLRQLFIDYEELLSVANIRLSDKKHSSTFFMFEDLHGKLYDGSIKLMGTGGNLTGLDVDVLICDDLIKGFYDTTPTLLAKKVEWFKEIILQRLEPHSKLIILGTRWAENDVIGYLEKQHPDDYKFIVLKALNEDGTCIWSNRYTPQFFINRRNEIGDRLFESLYQQRPLDETGSFFNIDKMIWHDTVFASHYVSNVRSWDLAYSDESKGDINDSTAGVPMYKVNDNHYVITDFEYGQYGEGLKNKLLSTAKSDGPNTKILLETGTKGGASKFLYTEYESYLKGYRCEQSEPIGSKVDRAYAFKEAILDGKIHVHIINPDLREIFIRQLKAFPLGKHDDIIDACAYAYNYLKDKGDITGIYGTGDTNY